ncbi:hypothetical protein [Pseudoroseicyclus aestuarii]|uniref:Uncharacterized protein n=1 Tax=Pseudoroseicyclus aestuarii TaxID=1795041 RepID=A0A318SVK7_9RHOB|nr:hypothetical protein [Pseudoroseicyclus aestuarii]PYE83887.1 hypothetical protein DFP88_103248 [Pseudoroseicyclus aestuarii]
MAEQDKNHRSAVDGSYVSEETARENPETTMSEDPEGEPTNRPRSTKTGEFVTGEEAEKYPHTTVNEDDV